MVDLKKELTGSRFTLGSWITLGDVSVAEIMAKSGFDWLVIDMEHSAITLDKAQHLIRVIELSGMVPLVRVGDNDPVMIKRVMDAGSHGVIVPMVNSAEDAERAVRSVRYPPKGTRGVGLARAQGYGMEFEKYRRWAGARSIVIVQIEHIDAINNLEAILSVDGVDGSIIGPYDLSGSLGYPGEFDRKEVKAAVKRYEEVCRKMNKPMGFHVVRPEADIAVKYKKKGFSFVAVGLDTLYLAENCRATVSDIRRGPR